MPWVSIWPASGMCSIQLQRGAQFPGLVWHLPWHKITEIGQPRDWENPVPPSCFELWIDPLVLSDVDQDGYNPRPAINNSLASMEESFTPLLPSALLDSCWDFPLHLCIISPCYHFHVLIMRLQYAVHWKWVTLLDKRDDKKVTWSWIG